MSTPMDIDYKPVPAPLLAGMVQAASTRVDPLLCGYRQLLDKLGVPRTGVLHLGGHIGQELPMYAALGFRNVIMVEPLPEEYAELSTRVDAFNETCGLVAEFLGEPPARAHAVRCAVTDRSGPCTFYRTGMTSLSSLAKPRRENFSELDLWDDFGVSLPWYKRPFKRWMSRAAVAYSEISVPGTTLDEMVDDLPHGWRARDFSYLRLNIQGAELKALQGGADVLRHISLIDLETNIEERYEDAPIKRQFDELLSASGFVAVFGYRIGPVGNLIYFRPPTAAG
ncbi:FkbM family methyltransferase [Lysobacter sp. CA199]|uniref:FkbM family methyltransferase n=1 Tax=Lysobacter sp. CA199 TaxID=3455608 RepID=UPI003F8D0709